jgi:hypothetical protein
MNVIQLAARREQSLLEKLRSKQAELVEVYRQRSVIDEISDGLIEEVKNTLTKAEWQTYSDRLDEAWNAARHSEDDMSFAFSIIHEAVGQLEQRR